MKTPKKLPVLCRPYDLSDAGQLIFSAPDILQALKAKA
jgi:hypothetical protein